MPITVHRACHGLAAINTLPAVIAQTRPAVTDSVLVAVPGTGVGESRTIVTGVWEIAHTLPIDADASHEAEVRTALHLRERVL